MRRNTLGVLNGNQSIRPKDRKSVGARPSTGGRLSTSGRPSMRRSSQYGRDSHAGQGPIKDTRNLSDRGVYRKNIRYLMEFLTEFNYPNPISERILSAPPVKEFKKIFLFIYGFINPNLKEKSIDKRPEEEIPKLFKLQGYPFTISKSSMFSVGSPHTWPNLLGALCWLIELTRFAMKTSENTNDTLFYEDNYGDKLYFNFLENSYQAFMRGKELDDLKEHEKNLFDGIREMHLASYQELDVLDDENANLEKELAELEQPSSLAFLVEKQKSLQADRETVKEYIDKLKKHSKMVSDSNLQHEEEIAALKIDLDALTAENNQRKEVLEKQELSPADVQRMNKEKKELIKQVKDFESNSDYLDKQIWELEIKFVSLHEETEKYIRDYNDIARKAKLAPKTAENANGFDFEIYPQQLESVLHYKDNLKPELLNLKERITEQQRNIQTKMITVEETLDQLGDLITDRKEELQDLASKQALIDKEFDIQKEDMANQHNALTQELQQRQHHISNIVKQDQENMAIGQQHLEQITAERDIQLQEMKKEEEEFNDFLFKACHLVIDHKKAMSTTIKETEDVALQSLEQTKKLKIPTSKFFP